jgi:hypothetical protein
MCLGKPKMPSAPTPGAAPAAPLPSADNLKMNERRQSKDGSYAGDTARSRRTLRTDVKIAPNSAGTNVPRMG